MLSSLEFCTSIWVIIVLRAYVCILGEETYKLARHKHEDMNNVDTENYLVLRLIVIPYKK